MRFKSFIFTGEKKTCTGCSACAQVCPQSALTMKPDQEGFLYPQIDEEKCIRCGICEITCPVIGNDRANTNKQQHYYVATTQEKRLYEKSASIGICTMLSETIIKRGGVVYGSYLDESDWSAYHIAIENSEHIERIRNSKYLQSNTRTTFTDVKMQLEKGRYVLFIGTPCQIAGLKAYLKKDYTNLTTIDLICHGVFSPMLMPLEVAYWERLYGGNLINFKFRSKKRYKYTNGGMVNFDIIKRNGKIKHYECHASSSPSYRAYAYTGDGINYNLRLSCYYCPFRSEKRYADITVGDPWFITDDAISNCNLKSYNTVRSLYFTNSIKGYNLISEIEYLLTKEEISQDEAFKQPALKKQQREIPPQRAKLYSLLNKIEYGEIIESLFECDLRKEQKKFIWRYSKLLLKKKIKELLRIN